MSIARCKQTLPIFAALTLGILGLSCGDGIPITDAHAGEGPVETYFEPCNNFAPVPSIGMSFKAIYAEHSFPNQSATELAAKVRVVAPLKHPFSPYSLGVILDGDKNVMAVRDGAVAFVCVMQNSSGDPPLEIENVTFVVR